MVKHSFFYAYVNEILDKLQVLHKITFMKNCKMDRKKYRFSLQYKNVMIKVPVL